MEDTAAYLQRKCREIELIDRCLAAPIALDAPAGAAAAIDRKFQLAGALRAERSLQSWAITETARPEVHRWRSGAFEFSFGYQRADLKVRGPALYDALAGSGTALRQHTLYTGSGMSAIAAVVTALMRVRGDLQVSAPGGCYSETRELLDSLGSGVTVVPFARLPAEQARSREPIEVTFAPPPIPLPDAPEPIDAPCGSSTYRSCTSG
jgi:hypothetical protein